MTKDTLATRRPVPPYPVTRDIWPGCPRPFAWYVIPTLTIYLDGALLCSDSLARGTHKYATDMTYYHPAGGQYLEVQSDGVNVTCP